MATMDSIREPTETRQVGSRAWEELRAIEEGYWPMERANIFQARIRRRKLGLRKKLLMRMGSVTPRVIMQKEAEKAKLGKQWGEAVGR